MNQPISIGSCTLPHRLIQGPLAGFSCAPMRLLFNEFIPPAYCVTEMLSAKDVLQKHKPASRYLYRHPDEALLSYQLSGNKPQELAMAAQQCEALGANLIDLNCGCPKLKIRKKGAGSALLSKPNQLFLLIEAIKSVITIPLTVKIRIQETLADLSLAQGLEAAGADALIIHGRRWDEDYDKSVNYAAIAEIKNAVSIPVIVNGDVFDGLSLERAWHQSGCDAVMVSRAGCGKPWIFQELLTGCADMTPSIERRIHLLHHHLTLLMQLEGEYVTCLQAKSLVRYYFKPELTLHHYNQLYRCSSIAALIDTLTDLLILPSDPHQRQ